MAPLLSKKRLNKDFLNKKGLNIQAVFNLCDLPRSFVTHLQTVCPDLECYNQIVVIGHKGRDLWHALQSEKTTGSENPIDKFSAKTLDRLFADYYPDNSMALIYPGEKVINLQMLGCFAGWHHTTPFKVGIHKDWGTWFAYRAVILADTEFETSPLLQNDISSTPCHQCIPTRQGNKPCISACPAGACVENSFDSNKCINYRKQRESLCKEKCLARNACPVGTAFRYSEEQTSYHYRVSMKMIETLNL